MSEVTDIAADLRADGQAMTLTLTTYSGGDAAAGDPGTPIVQTWTVYGLTKNYNSITRAASYNGSGSLILAGDKQATISAVAEVSPGVWVEIEPVPGDSLTMNKVDWAIIMVDTVDPQGVALMHKCQVRR